MKDDFERKNFSKKTKKNKIGQTIDKICRIIKNEAKNSRSLTMLFDKFSALINENELNEVEERESILRNPNTNSKWRIMLKNIQKLKKINPALFNKLLNIPLKIYQDIKEDSLTVDEASIILFYEDHKN